MFDHGELVELQVKYTGIYIFLSYLVSFVGSWTTIEMLLKRTGTSGRWNILLLLGAGIAFGSTATFGMHFVGPPLECAREWHLADEILHAGRKPGGDSAVCSAVAGHGRSALV